MESETPLDQLPENNIPIDDEDQDSALVENILNEINRSNIIPHESSQPVQPVQPFDPSLFRPQNQLPLIDPLPKQIFNEIFQQSKEPLLVSSLCTLSNLDFFNSLINRFLPKLIGVNGENSNIKMLVKSIVIGIIFFFLKRYINKDEKLLAHNSFMPL